MHPRTQMVTSPLELASLNLTMLSRMHFHKIKPVSARAPHPWPVSTRTLPSAREYSCLAVLARLLLRKITTLTGSGGVPATTPRNTLQRVAARRKALTHFSATSGDMSRHSTTCCNAAQWVATDATATGCNSARRVQDRAACCRRRNRHGAPPPVPRCNTARGVATQPNRPGCNTTRHVATPRGGSHPGTAGATGRGRRRRCARSRCWRRRCARCGG
jgi:hypothetical protein